MRPSLTPYEWREKHPRCDFCQYLRLDTTATRLNLPCSDYYECTIKNRIIKYPKMLRPWCRCYKIKQFDKEMTQLCVK